MNAQESLVRSKVLRYFAHVTVACVTLHTSAFCHCYLQESSSAQQSCCTHRYKCSDTVGGSNDERLTDVGMTEVCTYVGQPFVIVASGNHPLLDSISAFVPSFSPHLTPFLLHDHACAPL